MAAEGGPGPGFWDRFGPPLAAVTLAALLAQAAYDRHRVGERLDAVTVEMATARAEIRAANHTLDQILERAQKGSQ